MENEYIIYTELDYNGNLLNYYLIRYLNVRFSDCLKIYPTPSKELAFMYNKEIDTVSNVEEGSQYDLANYAFSYKSTVKITPEQVFALGICDKIDKENLEAIGILQHVQR